MQYQEVLNFVLATAMSVLGWFAKELWDAVKNLKSDISKLREELPKTYVAKDDYKLDLAEIKFMLNKIFDRLEGKQDK